MSRFLLDRAADIVLVTLVLVFACVGLVSLYEATGESLASFSPTSTFYNVYGPGQNPWAQAIVPEEPSRVAASARRQTQR